MEIQYMQIGYNDSYHAVKTEEKRDNRRRYAQQRARRLRRQRRLTAAGMSLAVVCMVIICTLSYGAIHTNASSGYKYYTSVTVNEGESLWELADRYIDYSYYKDKNAYIAEVQNMNHLQDPAAVYAGQTLILPYYSAEYIY